MANKYEWEISYMLAGGFQNFICCIAPNMWLGEVTLIVLRISRVFDESCRFLSNANRKSGTSRSGKGVVWMGRS